MRLMTFAATIALLAPFALASDARETQAPLRHGENDFLHEAHGNVGLRDGADFQRFSVVVEGVGNDTSLSLQLGDGHDGLVNIGSIPAGDHGRVFLRTTQEGGHLPLEAEHAADLSGRAVRVLDGEGHVILLGSVPAFEAPRPEPTPEPTPVAELRARAALVRPEHSPYDDSRGGIFVLRRADGSEALGFEVGHLAPQTHYEVFLGDDGGGSQVGDFTTNGEGGASITRDTAHGGELPGGATLSELAGRHISIRHGGDVVLLGAVPRLEDRHDTETVHETDRVHDEDSGAVAHVVVEIRPHEGHEHFRMDLAHLPRERDHHDATQDGGGHEGDPAVEPRAARRRARAEVYMDDGSGAFQPIGSSAINGRGRARLRYTTRRGGSLPLGAATLRELAGRAFQVRVNGTTVVSGSLPSF